MSYRKYEQALSDVPSDPRLSRQLEQLIFKARLDSIEESVRELCKGMGALEERCRNMENTIASQSRREMLR